MPKQRGKQGKSPRGGGKRTSKITLRRLTSYPGTPPAYELVFPREVHMREEDLAEVRAMLEMGEVDIAEDELRWLVGGCEELLEAHHMLGQIALGDGRIDLARAHFGYAYEIGLRALPKDFRGRLPYAVVSNQALLESAKGLAWCLLQLSHREQAAEVINWLLARDPDDPLQAAQLLQEEER